MAQEGPITRSVIGCIAIAIFIGLVIAAGANASLLFGGLSLLGGFASLGDRRRDMFSGFGLMAMGVIFLIAGFAMK